MVTERKLPSPEEALKKLNRPTNEVTVHDLLDAFLAKMDEAGRTSDTLILSVNGVVMALTLRIVGIAGNSAVAVPTHKTVQ